MYRNEIEHLIKSTKSICLTRIRTAEQKLNDELYKYSLNLKMYECLGDICYLSYDPIKNNFVVEKVSNTIPFGVICFCCEDEAKSCLHELKSLFDELSNLYSCYNSLFGKFIIKDEVIELKNKILYSNN